MDRRLSDHLIRGKRYIKSCTDKRASLGIVIRQSDNVDDYSLHGKLIKTR